LVTSPDIENQKLFLMFDAVSAHTDCLIQIVKEQRNSVVAAGVTFYSTAFSSQALFSKAFRGYRRGCLRCRLPCRWRRIIGIWITLARAFSN
ncbi:hypothetical protein ACE1V3_17590, partial [Aeromonas veronii bv. sobria]|uniref:hypothetical protein n=1 Tax=Aeromonas veronii TaxID=654 RepID=UPI0035C204EC